LTLLDCARYLHRAAGINGVTQIAKDLGGKADPRRLAKLADVKPLVASLAASEEKNPKWMLLINEPVEIDS